jgi:putative PIN family toxin of toxin-antitoxin system
VIRAVIDTNVLVSAMISSAGNEALLVMAINQGLVTPFFSPEILEEYSNVPFGRGLRFRQKMLMRCSTCSTAAVTLLTQFQ